MNAKTIIITFAVAAVTLGFCADSAAQVTVGTVDVQKIREDAPRFKKAFDEIDAMVKDFEQRRDRKRNELEELAADLQDAEARGLQGSTERLRRDLQSKSQDFQKFMEETFGADGIVESYSAELLTPLYNDLADVAKKIAKDRGLDLILDLEQVNPLFADESLDITDAMLSEFNKRR